MALDPRYIQAFTIEDVLLDKDTGAPLSGGLVYFYEDEQRTVLKPVFELTGTTPNYTYVQLPNPVVLSAIGTFEDALGNPRIPYFYPYDANGNIQRYYIYVTSALGVFQFDREAQPYVFETTVPSDQLINGENEIANPQFVEVSFNPNKPNILTFTGATNEVLPVAPDWDFIVSGTGTLTVQRIALTATDTPSNPPYVLDIQSSGTAVITLRQRFFESPRLLANAFVSGFMVAASEDGLQHPIQMQYNPSGGSLTDNVIIDAVITADGSYNRLQGNIPIVGTINPDPATTGYVDIDITIPVGAHIRISSIQVVGANTAVDLVFDQQTAARQIDHLFHYYESAAVNTPKKSFIPWWKFGLNPAQFSPASANITSQCSYILDQTILYQDSASQVSYIHGVSENNGVLIVKAQDSATDARFALITYIAPQSCQGAWGYEVSSRVRAVLVTQHGTQTSLKARLLWRQTLPPTLSPTEPIASWVVGSDPVFATGWNVLVPLNDPSYLLNTGSTGNMGADVYPYYDFDQFQLPVPASAATNMFALVVYTTAPLNSTTGTEDYIAFDEITLTPGPFAVDSDQFTYSEVLAACQFYWQQSYLPGIVAGTVSPDGAIICLQDAESLVVIELKLKPFTLFWNLKCISPTITFYSPTTGAAGQVRGYASDAGSVTANEDVPITNWTLVATNTASTAPYQNNSGSFAFLAAGLSSTGWIFFHYTANAQLGQ